VLPWVYGAGGEAGRLRQATGSAAAILNRVAAAHERHGGSLARLRRDARDWGRLLGEVGRIIEVMPLWKLQTVGRQRLDFLYPNAGEGRVIRLHGEAVYCLRRFRDLILFGCDRTALGVVRNLLRELGGSRCFYCDAAIRGDPVADHFAPRLSAAGDPQDLQAELMSRASARRSAQGLADHARHSQGGNF
jgi:hypothetical protein